MFFVLNIMFVKTPECFIVRPGILSFFCLLQQFHKHISHPLSIAF